MFADLIERRRARKSAVTRSLEGGAPENGNRRGFMKGLGVAAAGAAAATTFGSQPSQAQSAALDMAILNFALNLEYLEAEFYQRAANGYGLGPANTGNATSMVTGGRKGNYSAPVQAYASEIANEEYRHVLFLRSALGSAAVNEPAIDLTNSFLALGNLTGLSSNFDPFNSDTEFLLASYIFEDVGVTAYHGAAGMISSKAYLDAAAGILAVEAYHSGIIRTLLFQAGAMQQTAAISKLRAQLDGTYGTTSLDDQGVGSLQYPHLVVASDPMNGTGNNNSIAYDRTPRQVLNIVYGAANNSTKGLFFPNGLNGAITS